jgi:hypothetical protein
LWPEAVAGSMLPRPPSSPAERTGTHRGIHARPPVCLTFDRRGIKSFASGLMAVARRFQGISPKHCSSPAPPGRGLWRWSNPKKSFNRQRHWRTQCPVSFHFPRGACVARPDKFCPRERGARQIEQQSALPFEQARRGLRHARWSLPASAKPPPVRRCAGRCWPSRTSGSRP